MSLAGKTLFITGAGRGIGLRAACRVDPDIADFFVPERIPASPGVKIG